MSIDYGMIKNTKNTDRTIIIRMRRACIIESDLIFFLELKMLFIRNIFIFKYQVYRQGIITNAFQIVYNLCQFVLILKQKSFDFVSGLDSGDQSDQDSIYLPGDFP